jgi:5-methylcytosine-specific restriction protein A
VDRWRIKTDPGHVRVLVFRRDKGVCAVCGLDTVQWGRDRDREWSALQHRVTELPYLEASAARERFRRDHPHYFQRSTYWDADHIVPVVEGGGECDLDNYRTLCIPCHKRVTAELAARRAEQRRVSTAKPSSQQELF